MAEGKPEDVHLSKSSDQLMEDREARGQKKYWRELEESHIEHPAAALIRGQKEYWRKVEECGGFDIDGIHAPRGTCQLIRFDCKQGYGYPEFVDLYARLGLHRYNLLEGTNFQVTDLIKYNMESNCLSTYYMTLVATEPATGSVQTFQVLVDEHMFGRLDLTVPVARIRGINCTLSTVEPLMLQDQDERVLYKDELFEWPSKDAFNDRKRFYMVEEAEVRDNEWICLYLKLVLCCKDKKLKASHLSKLKILKVWIEATIDEAEPPNARLKAKSALVYITFRLASCGIKEHI
ncbi:unnamed protein product [Eruca vesicaria subsp. sativa]|uniref:Uncharacterized protein n=1 Tax=Eruca vesicaria subsp. sativa TaxID=29727 RepID=A0ABC8ITF3_ERUVS|nr:unnamed protein product [Eruca vesicaria subsp. sativa]